MFKNHKLFLKTALLSLSMIVSGYVIAKPSPSVSIQTPENMEWGVPDAFPAGATDHVLVGDPKKSGAFTVRLKLPANYKIPAYWQTTSSYMTVISGTYHFGVGDKFDSANGFILPAGSFVVVPAKTHLYAWTNEETVLQIHGIAPWDIEYVNKADDPRKQSHK